MTSDYVEDSVPLEPIRIFMFNDNVASVDGEILMEASGPHGLRSIANRLLGMGHDGHRELHVVRAGRDSLTRVLLKDAANEPQEDF